MGNLGECRGVLIYTVTVDKHVYSFHRHAAMTSVGRATVDDVTRLVELFLLRLKREALVMGRGNAS